MPLSQEVGGLNGEVTWVSPGLPLTFAVKRKGAESIAHRVAGVQQPAVETPWVDVLSDAAIAAHLTRLAARLKAPSDQQRGSLLCRL